ncbi:MAG: DeoR/GlpR transcriptional regulator [Lachnospiraceae bacterium]|nr:DeoR/GlpR transcriptional regulator [Lachnospiraceae bacterium]
MLAVERRNRIVEMLQQQKRVVVSDLSRQFVVSEETIRRDLDLLDREGIATKSYGGAVFNETNNIELPFNLRKKTNVVGKQKIAELVKELIDDGDHIFLDASTTAVFIAKAIKEKKSLTVITNSLENMIELADVSGWNIIASGGKIREGHLALVGPGAVESIANFNSEKVFLSCKALDMQKGIMEGNEEIAQTKFVMMYHAMKKYLCVDHTKFDQIAFSRVCDAREITGIVTDVQPSEAWMAYFIRNNIEVYYPE